MYAYNNMKLFIKMTLHIHGPVVSMFCSLRGA